MQMHDVAGSEAEKIPHCLYADNQCALLFVRFPAGRFCEDAGLMY